MKKQSNCSIERYILRDDQEVLGPILKSRHRAEKVSESFATPKGNFRRRPASKQLF